VPISTRRNEQSQTCGRSWKLTRVPAQKLTGDHSRLKEELAELKRSNEVFKDESANLRKQLAEKSGTPGGAVAEGQSGTQKAEGGYMKGLAKMFTDPEMKSRCECSRWLVFE
jgi:hypothetical protein